MNIKAEDIGFSKRPSVLRGDETATEVKTMTNELAHSRPIALAVEEPSRSESPTWPVLPGAAIYGLAGNFVDTVDPHTESDRAAILFQFLGAAANVIGPPGPHCLAESTRHPLILWPIIVGATSKARKGTSFGHVEKLFVKVDSEWAKDRVTPGLSSAEGLISEVRDDAEPPHDRRLLIVQSEFASVLRVMERPGNTLSALMRVAWDGGMLRTLVKNNPLKATGAHIGVIAHTTFSELVRYLSDTEAHNGFANRLLFICAKRSKYLPEGGAVPQTEFLALARRMCDVYAWVLQQGEFEMQRGEEARGLWAAIYPSLTEGRPGLLGAATSRGEAQVLRMSAVYALLDRSRMVRVEHLKAALGCWDYASASAKLIFADAVGDPVADRIRAALRDAGVDGLSRTQIRDLLGRHQSEGRITEALNQLAALGIAHCDKVPTEGRSIEMWYATEAIKATEG
jgi:hypothetical protein